MHKPDQDPHDLELVGEILSRTLKPIRRRHAILTRGTTDCDLPGDDLICTRST